MAMHDSERLSNAYHEAAHAVAALVQGCSILDCTLSADGSAGRVNIPDFYPDRADPAELRRYAIICLAGWEAQLRREPDLIEDTFAGSIESDRQSARICVGHAVTGEAERQATYAQWCDDARRLVAKNWAAIQRVGAALADRGNLAAEEVASLIADR